jgi:hypothetical protein
MWVPAFCVRWTQRGSPRRNSRQGKNVIAIEIDSFDRTFRQNAPGNGKSSGTLSRSISLTNKRHIPAGRQSSLPCNSLFKRFIQFRSKILDVTVMIQKRGGRTYPGEPNDDAYGLSVLIQYYSEPKWGFTVSPELSTPNKSRIRSDPSPMATNVEDATLHRLRPHAFGSRGKKLINNLIPIPHENRGN